MKKSKTAIFPALLILGIVLTGCSESSGSNENVSEQNNEQTEIPGGNNSAGENLTELEVRFGDDGEPFILHLEDNETAAAIAGYVGSTDWRLPISDFDDSDVEEYYDIPERYEIPSNPETITEVKAGEVYYSDPNRIVLYFGDAQINEEYTLVGSFEATDEFILAVQNNPILEGWDTKIVNISDGE